MCHRMLAQSTFSLSTGKYKNFDIIVDCCQSRWPHWLTRTDFRWHNTRAFYTTYSSNCELIAFLKRLSWSETYIIYDVTIYSKLFHSYNIQSGVRFVKRKHHPLGLLFETELNTGIQISCNLRFFTKNNIFDLMERQQKCLKLHQVLLNRTIHYFIASLKIL